MIPGIKTPAQAVENARVIARFSDVDHGALRAFGETKGTDILSLMEKQG